MLISRINVVTGALRTVGAVICDFIYEIIAGLYQLFTVIARLNVLQAVDIKPIYQRVTMILTIVMTFYITFQFVKYAIEPDTFTDKEKGVGNILKRIVIVVIMLAFMPNIFELGFKLQNRIIETQFISKAIIGKTQGDFTSYGNEFAANVLNLFYYVDDRDADGGCYNDNGSDCNEARTAVKENLQKLRQTGKSDIHGNINIPSEKSLLRGDVKPAIKFNGILAICAGGFMAYILVMYCVDLGTRFFQLLFLQLISPIAIMGYLLPKKEGIFQKWIKQVTTTFFDVFLRIAIMSFVMLLISTLGNAFDDGSIFSSIPEGVSGTMKVFAYIALVIGLLSFAKKAPKLLSDLFPSSGAAGLGFGLSTKDRGFGAAGRVVGGAAGAIIGGTAGLGTGVAQGLRRRATLDSNATKSERNRAALIGGLAGGARGLVGGTARGLAGGVKKGNVLKNSVAGAKEQIKSNEQFGNRQEAGYSLKDQVTDKARSALGLKSRISELEEQKKPYESRQKVNESSAKYNKAMREEAEKIVLEGKGKNSSKVKAAEQRVHDLRENGAAANGYRVGKYKDENEAKIAYQTAVQEAAKSVDAKSFFDRDKYLNAMDMAGAKVDRTKYATEVEYNVAVQTARASVSADAFINQAAYQKAVQEAQSKVDYKNFASEISKYASQAEADEAYATALAQADKDFSDAKKAAINDVLDHGDITGVFSPKIMEQKVAFANSIKEYNASAKDKDKRDEVVFDANGGIILNRIVRDSEGNPTYDSSGKLIIQPEKINHTDFDKYVKEINKEGIELSEKINDINIDIQKIKSETEGSGNDSKGGKK